MPRKWYDPHPVRRILQFLLNALNILSLILFAATAVLWVRGYYAYDMIGFRGRWLSARMESSSGNLAILSISFSQPWSEDLGWYWHVGGPSPGQVPGARLGFGVLSQKFGNRHIRALCVPAWSVALVTAALPAVRMFRWMRKPRSAPGHCPACGYDLRATPGRCPECGKIPTL